MKKFFLMLGLRVAFISLPALSMGVTEVEPNTLTKGLDPAATGTLSVPPLPSDTTGIQVTERPSDLNVDSIGFSVTEGNSSSSRITGDAFRTLGANYDSSSNITSSLSRQQTLSASHADIADMVNSGEAFVQGSSVSEDSGGSMNYAYILLVIGALVAMMLVLKKDKAVNPVSGPPGGPMGPPSGPMM